MIYVVYMKAGEYSPRDIPMGMFMTHMDAEKFLNSLYSTGDYDIAGAYNAWPHWQKIRDMAGLTNTSESVTN